MRRNVKTLMRIATLATTLAFVFALSSGTAFAQTATTTPGVPSTGFETSTATMATLSIAGLAAILGAAYVLGRKRAA